MRGIPFVSSSRYRRSRRTVYSTAPTDAADRCSHPSVLLPRRLRRLRAAAARGVGRALRGRRVGHDPDGLPAGRRGVGGGFRPGRPPARLRLRHQRHPRRPKRTISVRASERRSSRDCVGSRPRRLCTKNTRWSCSGASRQSGARCSLGRRPKSGGSGRKRRRCPGVLLTRRAHFEFGRRKTVGRAVASLRRTSTASSNGLATGDASICPACAAFAACSGGSGCSLPTRGSTGPTRPSS